LLNKLTECNGNWLTWSRWLKTFGKGNVSQYRNDKTCLKKQRPKFRRPRKTFSNKSKALLKIKSNKKRCGKHEGKLLSKFAAKMKWKDWVNQNRWLSDSAKSWLKNAKVYSGRWPYKTARFTCRDIIPGYLLKRTKRKMKIKLLMRVKRSYNLLLSELMKILSEELKTCKRGSRVSNKSTH
jgi:hypothetical protein